ncbi:glycosyltransferase [Winogradskyella sp.]|nr:glycosyltransferase [Winogradskyella sp.]
MKVKKPLVSVLMTVYNREKYIAEAIESVIASTYQNWELIIVDDQSTDNSVAISKSYEAKDERIKLYVNERNLGDYPNRNQAATYAKGKYIKYLDSDDLIYPHGLKVMVNAMEQFPEAGIGLTYNSYDGQNTLPVLFSVEKIFLNHFFKRGILYIGPTGCIYKRSYFEAIGGFDPTFKVAADYEFNMRAASQKPVVLFQRDLFWWRQHEGQEITVSSQNNEYMILNYLINKQNVNTALIANNLKETILLNNEVLMGRRLLKLGLKSFSRLRYVKKETGFTSKYFFRALLPTKKLNSK